jgi:tRNA U34 2-thiouridine synthase MnmA/TrmU
MSQAAVLAMSGKIDAANPMMRLAQSCIDVSNLIYTISENAGALYSRYAKSEQDLAEQTYNTFEKCAEALKQAVPPVKKK